MLLVPQHGAEGAALAALISAVGGASVLLVYLLTSSSLGILEVISVARTDLARLFSSETRHELATFVAAMRAR